MHRLRGNSKLLGIYVDSNLGPICNIEDPVQLGTFGVNLGPMGPNIANPIELMQIKVYQGQSWPIWHNLSELGQSG